MIEVIQGSHFGQAGCDLNQLTRDRNDSPGGNRSSHLAFFFFGS